MHVVAHCPIVARTIGLRVLPSLEYYMWVDRQMHIKVHSCLWYVLRVPHHRHTATFAILRVCGVFQRCHFCHFPS